MKRTLINLSNYTIENNGKVYSLLRNKYLKPAKHNLGYIQYYLKEDNGQKKWYKAHRLVAMAFIDNPDNKPEVHHIDHNKENNHYTNLQWVTHKENITESIKAGKWNLHKTKGHLGKTHSNKTKQVMSDKKRGENHPKFKGYYCYQGLTAPSLNQLAQLMETYSIKASRMYKAGLIEFKPKLS